MSPLEDETPYPTVAAVDYGPPYVGLSSIGIAQLRRSCDQLGKHILHDLFCVRSTANKPLGQTHVVARPLAIELLDVIGDKRFRFHDVALLHTM